MIVGVALACLARRHVVIAFICLGVCIAGEVYGLLRVYAQEDGLNGTLGRATKLTRLTEGINRMAEAGDEIVLEDLYWYLPFSYYNTTGIQPRLYIGDAWNDPGTYGGERLIPPRAFIKNVSTVNFSAQRVWWVNYKPWAKNIDIFPKHWRLARAFRIGEVEARLFILDGER